MTNTPPNHLFEKYASGTCTDEEKSLIDAWYLSQLKDNSARPSDRRIQEAKDQAWKQIMPSTHRRFRLLPWSAAAAIVIALLFVYLFRSTDKQSVSVNQEINASVSPNETAANVLYASKVENSMMKLPDGSTVILEKGSKLTLALDFNLSKTREVELEGKAFFDVQHDARKPFIIHSGTVNTTVLGTAFDVTSRPGSKRVTVNVIRGRVKVEDSSTHWRTILPKNYQVEFYNNSIPKRVLVNAAKELAWNQADLEFNDVSVGDAQSRLEEQFGYKIEIEGPVLKNTTFTYSMRRKESMESFIKGICAFIGASYQLDHKNKIISIQPLNQ